MIKLNLGAGENNKEGYINVDHRVEPAGTMQGNAFGLEEFEDNSVDEIRAYALLEHASQLRTLDILKLWYNKLVSGGVLNVSVPDMEETLVRCKKYLEAKEWDYDNWIFFNNKMYGGERELKHYGKEPFKEFPGVLRYEVGLHKSMFDEKTITNLMKMAGFKDVRRLALGEKDFSGRGTLKKEIAMVGIK